MNENETLELSHVMEVWSDGMGLGWDGIRADTLQYPATGLGYGITVVQSCASM